MFPIKRYIFLIFIAISSQTLVFGETGQSNSIHWNSWSDKIFEQAKQQNKYVLLDLEAVWCHWCHVMDEQTYRSPKIAALLNDKFIAVKVDQDSHPDLSSRYHDYGWPATIIFNSLGQEIKKTLWLY